MLGGNGTDLFSYKGSGDLSEIGGDHLVLTKDKGLYIPFSVYLLYPYYVNLTFYGTVQHFHPYSEGSLLQ